jgi:hypothetical protein
MNQEDVYQHLKSSLIAFGKLHHLIVDIYLIQRTIKKFMRENNYKEPSDELIDMVADEYVNRFIKEMNFVKYNDEKYFKKNNAELDKIYHQGLDLIKQNVIQKSCWIIFRNRLYMDLAVATVLKLLKDG